MPTCKILSTPVAICVRKYFVTTEFHLFFRMVSARLNSIRYIGSNFLPSQKYDSARLFLLRAMFFSGWRFSNPFSLATHPFLNLVKTLLSLPSNGKVISFWVRTAVLHLVYFLLFLLFFFRKTILSLLQKKTLVCTLSKSLNCTVLGTSRFTETLTVQCFWHLQWYLQRLINRCYDVKVCPYCHLSQKQ